MTPSGWNTAPAHVQRGHDRRSAQRARLAAPTVTVTVGGLLVDAVGSDVSLGGMRLMSARPVRVGDAVSLVFFLDGDIVSARGTVCWCARTPHDLFAFGVAFTALEEDGGSLLARFCRVSVS
ncbi:MAG TPA: PilZ domain-containing protein [Labilithrix sp.]|nr:PilZ domain-containing protein [Labilithrix sp.]